MSNATWVTPGRHSRLILDVTEDVGLRPAWHTLRAGGQINKAVNSFAASSNVSLQPGGAWTLAPHGDDLTRINTTAWSGTVVTASDVNLATGWTSQDTFRKPTETGMGASASLITSGSPAFVKNVAAGGTFDTELTADVTALPKPTLPSADIPMNRVLSSRKSYPENCGFCITFSTPSDYQTADSLLSFYFGGNTPVTPTGTQAGHFCVSLRGDGHAILSEYSGSTWVKRMEFPWAPGERAGNIQFYSLWIFPHGRDRISFRTTATNGLLSTAPGASGLFGALWSAAGMAVGAATMKRGAAFYQTQPTNAGYTPGKFMTGAGAIRMDVRRDLRSLIQIVQLKPPSSGTLVDLPFWIPFPIAANTVLTAYQYSYSPKDSSIAGAIYDASTGAALTPLSSSTFKSNAGQQAYFVRFTATPDAAVEQTPVLYGYEIGVAPANTTTRSGSGLVIPLRSASITGPDLDPTHDTASVHIKDPTNTYTILQNRARIRAQIANLNDAGVVSSVLFDGEVQRATAQKRGKAGKTYPSSGWRDYDVTLTGMWARVADALTQGMYYFQADRSGATDAQGTPLAWKCTDIIRTLLTDVCLFPASQVSIPDIDIRLPPVPESEQFYTLQAGQPVAELILKLCKEYLYSALTWDMNAGSAGMWRLLPNPTPPYHVLAAFLPQPAVSGRLATHPNSYATGTTFYEHDSLHTYVAPPECNYVLVVGLGDALPSGGGPSQVAYSMFNPVSFNFTGATSDPSSPDYLGRFVPVIVADWGLYGSAAVRFACRRIYDVSAHAQNWITFTSPLLLVTDNTDALQVRPRPLRVNDAIYVTIGSTTVTALVRSCNPNIERSDGIQRMYVEALQVS